MSAQRGKKKPSLLDILAKALRASGVRMSEDKARAVAKKIAPVARRGVKAEMAASPGSESLAQFLGDKEAKPKPKELKDTEGEGVRLRTDLETLPYTTVADTTMRVVHGYSTLRTYISAAVKEKKEGGQGMIAVRHLYPQTYNVKFYPTYEFWNMDEPALLALGAQKGTFLTRGPYQRVHMSPEVLEKLLAQIKKESKLSARMKKVILRLMGVTFDTLVRGFRQLSGQSEPASVSA